jgi:DNA-directed RNA polymerase subunit RPC12/RpoP
MMTVQITCPECGSGIHVFPSVQAKLAECDVCHKQVDVHFTMDHENSHLVDCAKCNRKDFFIQKDFNRKIGVTLFVIAAIAAIFTYGISFIVLYVADFFLFKKLKYVACCYNCNTLYRKVNNIEQIYPFNHEMHDRIVYSGHDFQGKQLQH